MRMLKLAISGEIVNNGYFAELMVRRFSPNFGPFRACFSTFPFLVHLELRRPRHCSSQPLNLRKLEEMEPRYLKFESLEFSENCVK